MSYQTTYPFLYDINNKKIVLDTEHPFEIEPEYMYEEFKYLDFKFRPIKPLVPVKTHNYSSLPLFKEINEIHNFDPWIKKQEQKQVSLFWTVEEIEYEREDIDKFFTLDINDQKLIKSILIFFLMADKLVMANLKSLIDNAPYQSAKHFYLAQTYIKGVHDKIYKKSAQEYMSKNECAINVILINKILKISEIYKHYEFDIDNFYQPDLEVKSETDKLIFKAIVPKINLMNKWKRVNSYLHNLVAFFAIESISFNVLFSIISSYRTENTGLKYLITINEFVARDENLHATFGMGLYSNYVTNHLPEEEFVSIIDEIVQVEIKFLETIIPEDHLICSNSLKDFINFAKHIGNTILKYFNFQPIYEIDELKESFKETSLPLKPNFF